MYKLCKLKNKSIEKVFIFSNSKSYLEKDKLIDEDDVEYIDSNVYSDTSIEVLKKKIIEIYNNKICFDEIYLFGIQELELNIESIYNALTHNNKLELTYERLYQYISNIEGNNTQLEKKDTYSFNDLLKLNLTGKHYIKVPIGQKIFIKKYLYNYTVNPFDLQVVDPFINKYADQMVTTLNQELLLNYDKLKDNKIFMVLAEDVFNHIPDSFNNIITKLYFPFLYYKNIVSKSDLLENKNRLINSSELLIDEKYKHKNKAVDLLYKVTRTNPIELNYITRGIKYLYCVLHSNKHYILPLERLFKKIHTNKHMPLIKLNAGARREKIYRLYTNAITDNGEKVPYLSKATIIRLTKEIGMRYSISFYIEKYYNSILIPLAIELDKFGSLHVEIKLKAILDLNTIDIIVKEIINKLIRDINVFLQEGGYILNEYVDITNTEIIEIKYSEEISISENIDFQGLEGCIYTVFNIIEPNLKKNIVMRYKRVANYNEMSGQQAFIITLINKGMKRENIITALENNYNISYDEAISIYGDFLSEIQIQQGLNENKRLKIRNNPGFLTTIKLNMFSSSILINVENIDNINYLDTIPKMLYAIIALTQDKSISTDGLCDNKFKIEEDIEGVIEDIVAPSEKNYLENKQTKINNVEELILDEDDDEYLNMLLDDEDDEEELEDETEVNDIDDTNNTLSGGEIVNKKGSSNTDNLKDITGMSLSNPNYFFNRMQQLEPKLFIKKTDNKAFKAYSRLCPSNVKRQPVILTQEEKDKIDKEHPNSYTHSIKYGSDPNKQYYYICPRYWCIKDNTSLSKEEVEAGACGGKDAIIPENAKKVPPGKYIYEFNASREHIDKDGNYIQHYPGFISGKNHPDRLCVPCCFKSWDTKSQIERRKECNQNVIKDSEDSKNSNKIMEVDDYIKGVDKFPLDENRWGFLPIILQNFFNVDKEKCVAKGLTLNNNVPCLLRHGIELNDKQSFVGCIADLFVDYMKDIDQVPTIKEMKKIIIKSISLDSFIKLNNGNLIQLFKTDNNNVNIDKYKDSNLYKTINQSNESEMTFFKMSVNSYINFIEFLNNDNIIIDHTHLWDVISIPNKKLFNTGLNIILINIIDDDITNNIELICPSNHYSNSFFNAKYRTFIIMKKGNYYEPIYNFMDTGNTIIVQKTFTEYGKLPANIRNAIITIKNHINKQCAPLNSLPDVYTFKQNIVLKELLLEFKKLKNIEVKYGCINYLGKVIGIHVLFVDIEGFIPCYPSAQIDNIKYKFIYDYSWQSLKKTIYFLNKIKTSNSNILCKPVLKIEEDELIIGILTETNQFIQIDKPSENTEDDLDVIKGYNYITAEKETLTNNSIDVERDNYIQKIKLEKNFYMAFRNILRIEINKYINMEIRDNIQSIIHSNKTYNYKLYKVIDLLHKLLDKLIIFTKYDNKILQSLKTIINCSNCEESYCLTTEDGCKLMIPYKNLVNNKHNKQIYFIKLADELIRYNRVQLFIFDPTKYLTLTKTTYDINYDEILILSTMITQEYFNNLVANENNNFIYNNSYDTSWPNKTHKYDNYIKKIKNKCTVSKKNIGANKWSKLFPKSFYELSFDSTNICTYSLFLNIKNTSIHDIKQILINKYKTLNSIKVLNILKAQGKSMHIDNIKDNMYTLETYIMTPDYYLTNLDIWILALHYNLPIVFISSTKLLENKGKVLSLYPSSTQFIFIRIAPIHKNKVPSYSLIKNNNSHIINMSELSETLNRLIGDSYIELDSYIDKFKIIYKKVNILKKD